VRRLWFPLVPVAIVSLVAAGLAGCGPTASRPEPGPSTGQPGNAARGYLDGLARRMDFSGAVLIARDGHVLLRAGFGLADVARRIPNTPATQFRIASLTKQFTAMAILQLQDMGRISVGDHLCRFITWCPAAWRPITVAELLTHTSGIPDYETLPGYRQLSRRHVTPARLAALVTARRLLFRPGTRWSYSNTGYILLGLIIERVTGRSYADFLSHHVFAPLEMRNTGYDINHPRVPGHAIGYVSGYQPASYIDMSVPYAAGALYSTVDDLSRWDDALMGGYPRLVRPDTLQQMFHPWIPVNSAYPDEGSYGYGWFIDLHGTEYDHDGDINGFVSSNAIFPNAHAEIIILSNLESSDVRSITDHLAALIGLHAR
jgi:CubicO group peptidase (beta-lactamase class C family)